MRRALRPLTALALTALIGLAGAGCGSSGSTETGDAGGGGGSAGGAGSGATPGRSDQDRAVRFADCIRGHGVPSFPDANPRGEFVFGIDVSPEVWARAVAACRHLQPPGTLSARRDPREQSTALQFARCMRENGVEDFPDPVNGEPLIDTTRIPSSERSGGMAIIDAAIARCREHMSTAVADQ